MIKEWFKEQWRVGLLEITCMHPVIILLIIIILSGISLFGLYAYFDISKPARLSLDEFNQIIPQEISYQKAGKSTILLITKNRIKIDRGRYTPNFQNLIKAAKQKKITKIWMGENLYMPKVLKSLLPEEVPVFYQIASNNEILVSYDDMINDYKGKLIAGYLLLLFPFIGIPLIIMLILGFKLKLQEMGFIK